MGSDYYCPFSAPFSYFDLRKTPVALEPQAFIQPYYLTASFNALPGLNAGTLLAAI